MALHTVVPMQFRTRTVGTGKGHQVRMESQNTSCLITCKPKQGVPKAVFLCTNEKTMHIYLYQRPSNIVLVLFYEILGWSLWFCTLDPFPLRDSSIPYTISYLLSNNFPFSFQPKKNKFMGLYVSDIRRIFGRC